MAKTTPDTILLRVNGGPNDERPVYEDLLAVAAVTPGDLIEHNSGGVRRHNAAGIAQKMFAVENPYIDPRVTATKAVDTSYASGAAVRRIYPQTGDVIWGWIADGETVAVGSPLISAGAGSLGTVTIDADDLEGTLVAWSEEAKTASGKTRCKIRIA